ncbi:ABC transporter ATP-binding protein [Nostoc sp. CMAA1605]|uniref:ABC transporter ATP-binding protein n=1 Tax=Nostoc sp. CMAA1605 TaxID=2055159 RepID=UPI001F3B975E|nr:ABC transporter ATP-binding protein [Nostoc sp. CMAA1605]MCF4967951.1 ABC transporter ATP-binding protein [Nostoc sp. CMAA1605]
MSDTVIRVENLGKKYIIGHQTQEKYTALRDVIANGAKGLFKSLRNQKFKPANYQEEFWALKDVSFEIKQGDRVGIIGRNGAGKSTLLKILSRITEPTQGNIKIKGRVASLLEVGTGFHPELTGRENIYLNGAILGMSKVEIKRKFDEIVAFAEVEKFLDTPVKRYSSGMYVRLAFAVAAHLEPEILIVDEVLAVGDAQFQKKCLGKMEEVGKEGRTVLFVSHQMATVTTLCQRAIWLLNGQVHQEGNSDWITSKYLIHGSELSGDITLTAQNQDPRFYFKRISLLNSNNKITSVFDVKEAIKICLEYCSIKPAKNLEITIRVYNSSGIPIFSINRSSSLKIEVSPGNYIAEIELPANFLVPDTYTIDIGAHVPKVEVLSHYQSSISFEIEETGSDMSLYKGSAFGVVFLDLNWREDHISVCR